MSENQFAFKIQQISTLLQTVKKWIFPLGVIQTCNKYVLLYNVFVANVR